MCARHMGNNGRSGCIKGKVCAGRGRSCVVAVQERAGACAYGKEWWRGQCEEGEDIV